ncbi:MAG: CHAT domain-containing tetratricopeptide repeat protein [Nostoc sp.]|uniref:CHAT domain-containing tetratricopeptide repeat protein n=1 Tax=Nostoc sp. TaxID=1180 RepID=UPI002FFCB0B7
MPQPYSLRLILLLCLSLCSETVSAYPKPTPLTPPSQLITQSNTPDSNRAAAQKAEAEGQQLDKQKAPLLSQVIPKWEEALKYWRLAKDRKQEAKTLNRIVVAYFIRGEYPKALEYAQKAMPICQALGDHHCVGFVTSLLALTYDKMGEYQKANDMRLQLPLLSPKEPNLQTIIFSSIAQTYGVQLGEQKKALEYYNKALASWKEKGDVLRQAEELEFIALFYTQLGEINKSVEILKQANILDPEFKRSSISDVNYYFLAHSICSDKLALLKKPPKIEQRKNSSNQSATPNTVADANNRIEKLKQKAQKWRTQESLSGEVEVLQEIGYGYSQIGEYQKVLEVYKRALELRKIMGSKPEEASTLTDIADILNRQGKKQEAIDALNQALDIQRQIKNLPDEAATLLTLGDVYSSLGAYSESLDKYKQALSKSRTIGNRSSETMTLSNIGAVYRKLQDYPQALNYYQQALSISKDTGNCLKEALSLNKISFTYLNSGDYQQAISFGNQALALSRNLGVVELKLSIQANMLDIRAEVEIKQGNYSQALEDSQKARKLAGGIGLTQIEGSAYTDAAEAYTALKQPQKAIQTYEEQLALYDEMGFRSERAQSLYNIAKLQRQNKQLPAALSQIDDAIKIIENIRKEVTSTDLRTSFFATVQDYYRLKIDILMELHKKDPSKGYDAKAIETSDRSRARGLVELLTEARANIRKGANPKLLEEEQRLQALIDAREKLRFEIVNSNKIKDPISQANADKLKTEIDELLGQQKELETKIRQSSPKYANLKYPQPLKLPQIQQQLDKDTLLLQYSLGEERSFLWVVSPNSLDTYELPKKAEIEKSAINLFCLISQNTSKPPSVTNKENPCTDIKTWRTDKAATELSQLILAPVKDKLGTKRLVIVADGALQYIPFAALADLTPQPTTLQGKGEKDKLPSPTRGGAGGEVISGRGIDVIPNMPASGNNFNYQPLFVNHEIVNLPSASTIAIQRQELNARKQAPKTLAIFADPVYNATDTRVTDAQNKQQNKQESIDIELERSALNRSGDTSLFERLLGTRTEAETILKLVPDYNSLQAFDFDANYTLATSSSLNQYRILHFATHGFVNDENPELSGIVLSLVDKQGKNIRGYLRLEDLFNLDYPADLIVLSACETGLGKEIQGEGLVGLTRGLMYAGAERLVVSLWQVSDEGTSVFMQEFYKQMLQQGKPANQALRETQLKMWHQEKWRNPNYWAAFTFLGEWR